MQDLFFYLVVANKFWEEEEVSRWLPCGSGHRCLLMCQAHATFLLQIWLILSYSHGVWRSGAPWPGFHIASWCPSANTWPQSLGHDGSPHSCHRTNRAWRLPSAYISDLLLGDFWMPLLTTSDAHKTEKMSLPLLPRYIVPPAFIYHICHLFTSEWHGREGSLPWELLTPGPNSGHRFLSSKLHI